MPGNLSETEDLFTMVPLGAGETVSPFNLSTDMSKVVRLLLLAGLAVLGSIGNIFMISSVMIEDHLNKRGNAFLVNVALADLLVTGLIIPASAVVLLAGIGGSLGVCNFQWFLAVLCCLVTTLTLAATAMENYARLCLSQECYARLTATRITVSVISIWLLSTGTVALQFVFDLGPDYCARKFSGVLPYHAVIGAGFMLIPALVTLTCYARIVLCVHMAKTRSSFKPPAAFNWDYSLMKTNIYSFLLFNVFWLPFSVILFLSSIQTIPEDVFDKLTSLALSKSCVNNMLYCFTNRHFRSAYVNLFHYCCCKTTVSFSRRPRGEPSRPTGDVRVHIIPGYNMYSYTSPQRASREVGGKAVTQKRNVGSCRPSTSRPNGRDVYEL